MRRLFVTTILCTAWAAGPGMSAASFDYEPSPGLSQAHGDAGPDTLWQVKNDNQKKPKHAGQKGEAKGKGHAKGKDKGQGKPEKQARGKPDKDDRGNKPAKAAKDNGNRGAGKRADRDDVETRVNRITDLREKGVERLLDAPAPRNRDMAAILGATALGLAGPDLDILALPDEEILTFRNCPPGLAKKDPPCVPPGLAKKGVTYDEWARYSDEELDDLLIERRREYLDSEPLTDREMLLLESAQIERLFDLDPAPEGQRYALIDGQPVLLTDEDYTALLRINELARVADVASDLTVAPTAALTQEELMRLYRLPTPEEGYNYAVLNGQIIALRDDAYETLQLIRIARAVL